ncbi:MAG TPA: glycosyltransferase family A protein [Solirubrobacterales bacterium]|jgi:glycosyltransferase involved in cell wall biosynthesis|nr:glycosyltransferase family A protein [Solirubrobacterales bacterium]
MLSHEDSVTAELVSVAILAHGHARLLPAAIESVLGQGDPELELLVVEHEPSDQVAEILDRYRDTPLQHLASGGDTPGAARNAGVSAAAGSLLAFLDADDLWPPRRLAAGRSALESDPDLHAAFGRVQTFQDRPGTPIAEPAEAAKVAGPTQTARMITAAVFRRASLERVGPFDAETVLGSEIEWVARAEDAGLRFGWLDDVVLLRRSHDENTTRLHRREYGDYARVLKRVIDRRRGRA